MSDVDSYWKRVVSNCLRYFQDKRLMDAVTVIKNSSLNVKFCWYDDNWYGGINYWNLVFRLKNKDFTAIDDRKEKIEGEISEALTKFSIDDANKLNKVLIQPRNEDCIDWNAILPMTKEQTIALINEEQELLLDVAKCNISFKKEGIEKIYQKRHLKILSIARKAYFDYPEEPNTLADWWNEVKNVDGNRHEYISKRFSPILKKLRESDDNITDVDFSHIGFKSETVKKAAEEAVTLIRDGLYDSAFDRVHTVFHGYLRQLLKDYNVAYNEDDGLPALFTKLSKYYGNNIKPAAVAERMKTILRSAGGIIKSVNELRNNNTIVHPNEHLIQKRDAELVIRIVNALLDYIEEIDKEYKQQERLIET